MISFIKKRFTSIVYLLMPTYFLIHFIYFLVNEKYAILVTQMRFIVEEKYIMFHNYDMRNSMFLFFFILDIMVILAFIVQHIIRRKAKIKYTFIERCIYMLFATFLILECFVLARASTMEIVIRSLQPIVEFYYFLVKILYQTVATLIFMFAGVLVVGVPEWKSHKLQTRYVGSVIIVTLTVLILQLVFHKKPDLYSGEVELDITEVCKIDIEEYMDDYGKELLRNGYSDWLVYHFECIPGEHRIDLVFYGPYDHYRMKLDIHAVDTRNP